MEKGPEKEANDWIARTLGSEGVWGQYMTSMDGWCKVVRECGGNM